MRTGTCRSGSPTGSIRTIGSMDSHSSVSSMTSSGTGSRSTVYVPPMADIPDIPGFPTSDDELYASGSEPGGRTYSSSSGTGRYQSLLSSPSVSSPGSRRPSTFISSYHSRTVDDTVINGDEYVYPGDSRVIPSCHVSSRLRRSGSMMDLGSDGFQSNRSSVLNGDSDDQFYSAGTSSASRSSAYSSAESLSVTGMRTLMGLTTTGLTGTSGTTDTYTATQTGTTDTYTRTGTTTDTFTRSGATMDTYTRTGTTSDTYTRTYGTETGTRVSETKQEELVDCYWVWKRYRSWFIYLNQ